MKKDKSVPEVVRKAFEIAVCDLKKCSKKEGILAGLNHFSEYWSWDGFFAGMGAVKVGMTKKVAENLQLFLDNTSELGQVPYRIGSRLGVILKTFGLHDGGVIRPWYKLNGLYFWLTKKSKNISSSKLANSMLLVAIGDYLEVTRDMGFLNKNRKKIELINGWLLAKEKDGLIHESWHENWADSLRTEGGSLFTNVCYWKGVTGLAKHFGEEWERRGRRLKKQIVDKFWRGQYLAGWDHDDAFLTDGNMLAVWWKMLDKIKSAKVIKYYKEREKKCRVPGRLRFEEPEKEWIPDRFKLLGMADYHGKSVAWLWLGAIAAMAGKVYDRLYCGRILERLAKRIVEGRGVFEIYELDGRPVKRRFYKAEQPFAWNAGMFIRACTDVWPSLGHGGVEPV